MRAASAIAMIFITLGAVRLLVSTTCSSSRSFRNSSGLISARSPSVSSTPSITARFSASYRYASDAA